MGFFPKTARGEQTLQAIDNVLDQAEQAEQAEQAKHPLRVLSTKKQALAVWQKIAIFASNSRDGRPQQNAEEDCCEGIGK